jgi:hypothetical protein
MYNKNHGRFTSVDPMLSSGLIESPQTWNRYSYVSNNPLTYTDPLGLYKWTSSLGGDATDEQLRTQMQEIAQDDSISEADKDEQIGGIANILRGRQSFRDALTTLESAANNQSLTQTQRNEILRSRNAYGTEGNNNGVTVGTGVLAAGVGAQAKPTGYMYENGQATRPKVEVTIGSHISGQELIMAVGHEGSHVADRQEAVTVWATTGNYNQARDGSPTKYGTENRAYHVSAAIAQHQNRENLIFGGHTIWTRGMQNVDQQALDALLQSRYSVTPTQQGERILP